METDAARLLSDRYDVWPFLQNWGEGPLRCCKLQGVFQNDEGGITLQQIIWSVSTTGISIAG